MTNDNKTAKMVLEISGKQHVVEAGGRIVTVQPGAKEGDTIEAKDLLTGKSVGLKVLKNFLGKKIHGLKFHSKSRYTRRYGHRQPMSLLELVEHKPKAQPQSKTAKKPAKKVAAKKESK
jgi:ribosomal protein L21